MSNTKKGEQEEKSAVEIVMEEFAKEQSETNKVMNDMVASVNKLNGTAAEMKEKIGKPQQVSVTVDTKPVETVVKNGLVDIQQVVAAQPKNVIRKFQILLFPEQDARLFYKIVFGRWLIWLTIMLVVTDLYKWGVHYSDNSRVIELRQIETDRVKNAWDYLYKRQGKAIKRLMDSAYVQSNRE